MADSSKPPVVVKADALRQPGTLQDVVPVLTIANAATDARTAPLVEQPGMRPLVPPLAVPLAAGAAAVLGVVSSLGIFVGPWAAVPGLLAFVAAALAGIGAKPPSLAGGSPLIPLTLVPVFGSSAVVLATLAEQLSGVPKTVTYFAALVAAWLSGKALPTPAVPK